MCAYVGRPLGQFYGVSLAVFDLAGSESEASAVMRIKGANEHVTTSRLVPSTHYMEGLFAFPKEKAGLKGTKEFTLRSSKSHLRVSTKYNRNTTGRNSLLFTF